MPAWFYILRLRSGTLYPGATTNLEQRWCDHQSGQACRTTKLDPPAALLYQEQFETFSAARRQEAQVKSWSARRKSEALAEPTSSGSASAVFRSQKSVFRIISSALATGYVYTAERESTRR
jgi:predicted GIY-YIG superfamily endonuclease